MGRKGTPAKTGVSPNKISAREQRKIENERSRMRSKGVGQDEATRRAVAKTKSQVSSGKGGGSNAAGERQRPTKHKTARRRTGSRSNAS